MASIFYQVFNKSIELNQDVIKQFLWDIEKLYTKFTHDNDIDNLRVLKNKIEHLLEDKPKKLSKRAKKNFKQIDKFLEKLDDFLDEQDEDSESQKLVDVISEVEDDYKKWWNITEENKDKYRKSWIKKKKIKYEKELISLQVELLKLQKYIKESWEKLLIIFEWRDAAWKGGTIKRFREYLNPRWARIVALEKPSDIEKTQWYFQRYISHLPAGWEMAFFDRSWYNRAWVEPVMGFVNRDKYNQFLEDTPKFEKMLSESGIKIVKFYFSVSKEEQAARFESRVLNPLKQYKLSPIDKYSQQFWDKYTVAEYNNIKNTNHKDAPWVIINSNNKKKARINAIKYVLNQFDYPEKIDSKKLKCDDKILITWKDKIKELEKEIDKTIDLFN